MEEDTDLARALEGAAIHDEEGRPLDYLPVGEYVFRIEHAYRDDTGRLHVFLSWEER